MDEEYYARRADKLADDMRNYLLVINGGALVAIFTQAAQPAAEPPTVSLAWWATFFFVASLMVLAVSLAFAKHKALKRRDWVRSDKKGAEDKCKALFQRSQTYDIFAMILTAIGFIVGLHMLAPTFP